MLLLGVSLEPPGLPWVSWWMPKSIFDVFRHLYRGNVLWTTCHLGRYDRRYCGGGNSGTFIEKIATSQSYTPALYEVEIFAISETEDRFGQKYEVTNSLFVELFR